MVTQLSRLGLLVDRPIRTLVLYRPKETTTVSSGPTRVRAALVASVCPGKIN